MFGWEVVEREQFLSILGQALTSLQESCPQNNFRRIIASYVPAGEFFNHTVNYCTANHSEVELELILAILNSKLADWYFRLGSTNAHVSHYQLNNLPCPLFADSRDEVDEELEAATSEVLREGRMDEVVDLLSPHLEAAPFRLAIRDLVVKAVQRIISIERDRGEISRTARSALAPSAQPYQDVIDRLLYEMAGLTAGEAMALESRLERML